MNQNSFEEKVTGYIKEQRMLEEGCSVTLGVSGGADSVCLFFMLLSLREVLKLDLGVIHVMHGIRGDEAERDMVFTKALCEEHGIRFKCVKEDVPKLASEKGLSVEEAGRLVRYEALKKEGTDRIAVAHNLGDLAETVLFNLIRGSDIKGLCGISPVNGKIIRPLLCVTRQEIEGYLESRGQKWCVDSTNTDTAYSRNRIRNVILSEAEKINPMAAGHIAKTAGNLSEAEDYLSSETKEAFREFGRREDDRVVIRSEAGKKLHPYILSRMIYEVLCSLSGRKKDISAAHVRDVKDLFFMQSGRSIDLIYGLKAKRNFDEIRIEKKNGTGQTEGSGSRENEISLRELIKKGTMASNDGRTLRAEVFNKDDRELTKVSNTNVLDYDKIESGTVIRVRREGDRISIRGGHKKVKDVLIERKIPEEKRNGVLLLAHESEVYWIEGIRIGFDAAVGSETERVLVLTVE